MNPSPKTFNRLREAKIILLAGFVAGTLDITGAILVYCYVMKALSPLRLLQGISVGLFGDMALHNEIPMAFIGLGIHYAIAFCFTIMYFFAFSYIPFLRKQRIISGLLYGVFVWSVMNLIVLPLSNAHHYPFNIKSALTAVAILILCIGLPISMIISQYRSGSSFKKK